MRISPWTVVVALACCVVARGGDEPKTVDDVLARYVDALGGKEKLAARKTQRLTSKVSMPQNLEGEVVQEWKRPDQFRIETTLPQGKTTMRVVQAFDGKTWWQTMPTLGQAEPQPISPELARLYADYADIDGPLVDARAKGHKVELVGREEVDGKPAYKLKLVRKDAGADEFDEYTIAAASWLPVKVVRQRHAMGITTKAEQTLSDYRRADGVMVAYERREVQTPGDAVYVTHVEKVETNIALPDERFRFEVAKQAAATSAPTTQEVPQGPVVNDPAARKVYDGMIAALRAADSLTFDSKYEVRAGVYGVTCGYKAWLKKPNYFRVEATDMNGKAAGILIGDGMNLWIYWPQGRPRFNDEELKEYEATRDKVYMTKPAPPMHHSIGHEVGLLGGGMIMNILDLSTFHGYTDSLQPLLDGVARHGTETFAGEPCDVIDLSFMDGQRVWRLWISQRDHLPRKLSETVHVANDIHAEEVWTNIRLNEPIADEQFVWEPPEGWQEWQFPETEQTLLKPGTPAPDFDLKLADGKTTKLSDYRGKLVWLVFWRVGCPPCRKEAVYLQKLHAKYADKGLVVLGFNSADKREIALDLMHKLELKFPCILDSSSDAQQIAFDKYKSSAVPTTYLIDRDGKIAAAWVGFSEDDPRITASLKKLGFE